MKKRKRWIWGLGVLLILAGAVYLYQRPGTLVEVVDVKTGTIARTVEETGYVEPVESLDLYADQYARVVETRVETGDKVKKDQVLIVLENPELAVEIANMEVQLSQAQSGAGSLKSSLHQMELELSKAEKDLKRGEELFNEGAITQDEYEEIDFLADTARGNVGRIKEELARNNDQVFGLKKSLAELKQKKAGLVVESPFDGVVLELSVKQEGVVSPGSQLISVAKPDQLKIKVDILSDDLAQVKLGQPVLITAPVLGKTVLKGTVMQIYPKAEEKQSALGVVQRRVPVMISFQETGILKPGYEVQAAIQIEKQENVLVLPRESVRTTGTGEKEVFLVDQGKVKFLPVETGIFDSENIEITGGLKKGDMVIKNAGLDLKEGQKIETISQ